LVYIFVAASMGLPSFNFALWDSKDASFLQQSAFFSIQGHPRSMILVPIVWLWSYFAPFLR